MNMLEIAKNRYTTKKYNAEKKVDEEIINQLKEILHLSPSSINSQPWKFTFIADADTKTKFAEASFFNKAKIDQASHLVVFSAINNIEKFEERINKTLPEGSVGYYNQFLKPQTESEIKSWLKHQVYLSLGFFLSAAATLGIDSTPMEGIDVTAYQSLLADADYTPLFAVALGYRDQEDSNQPQLNPKSRRQFSEVIESL